MIEWKCSCPKCGRDLDGLVFDYGRKWLCSDCAADKSDVLHAERGCLVAVKSIDAGYTSQADQAKELFNIGDVYTVESVSVGSSSSSITLKEFPGKHFNTVFFKRIA